MDRYCHCRLKIVQVVLFLITINRVALFFINYWGTILNFVRRQFNAFGEGT